ncbi:hypothetical protein LTR56_017009 [Elasticomyces elasticus]|nr:hypothetical protein LTR56_017009 [Elasticomyces elasticus]KAK3636107.1 hypothetical protein LTR22_018865 [Elasticomyces elasticus]KAK4912124.1 hypothetical protein LTR49_019410 [Elasticomyces elasticus]KAK5753630.1 hypothetical protein LTS12_016267 [Elasticomyces elasticus]
MDSADIKTEEQDLSMNGLDIHSSVTSALEEPQITTSSFTPINNVFHPPGAMQSVHRAFPPPAAVMTQASQGDGSNDDSLFIPLANKSAKPTSPTYPITEHGLHDTGKEFPTDAFRAGSVAVPAEGSKKRSLPDPAPRTDSKRAKQNSGSGPRDRTRGRVRPYDVAGYDDAVEKAGSQLAVDQPCFKEIERLVPVACDLVTNKFDALVRRGYHDKEIETICGKLKHHRYVSRIYPKLLIVGVLGNTAAGKSSLLNCLLNKANIVLRTDRAHSGTNVVEELAMAELGQLDPIKVVVYYFTTAQIELQIKQHVDNVCEYHHPSESELDSNEQQKLSMNYETAVNYFSTLLCDRNDFCDTTATATFFARTKCDPKEPVLASLKQFVRDYVESLGRDAGATTFKGNSMDAIKTQLARFRGPVSVPEGSPPISSPWPLVSKITTYLHARILSEGLVLSDLPGTSDTNRYRVKLTEDYIRRCDLILMTAPIERFVDNDSVWSNVVKYIRSGMQGNIILVPTKTDLIDLEILDRSKVAPADLALIDERRTRYQDLREDVKELEEQVKEVEADGEDVSLELNKELRLKKVEIEAAKASWKEEDVLARNRETIAGADQEYKLYSRSDEDVTVIPVSNVGYQGHQTGYDNNAPPALSLEATGICDLRQHLYNIPAQRKFTALRSHCRGDLARALYAVELQCSKTRFQRKQRVKKHVVKPLSDFQTLLMRTTLDLTKSFSSMLQDVVGDNEQKWVGQAQACHMAWAKYKFKKYGAFCRYEGQWKGPDNEEVDWNAALHDIIQQQLFDAFGDFISQLGEAEAKMVKGLNSSLDQLNVNMEESVEWMGLDLTQFQKAIKATKGLVEGAIVKRFEGLVQVVTTIRFSATSAEAEAPYLMQEMKLAYSACAARQKKGGKGVFAEMKEIMKAALCGANNIFLQIAGLAVASFDQQIEHWTKGVEKQVGDLLDSIIKDFDGHFYDDSDTEDPTNRNFREELLLAVKEAVKIVEGPMEEKLTEAEKYR